MDDILHLKLPVQGSPDEALPVIEEIITSFIQKKKTLHFFIGQSLDLTSTKEKHGCHAVVNLYNSRNAHDVRHLEFLLLKEFYRNDKNLNLEARSGEDISDKSMNYLYLALWFK